MPAIVLTAAGTIAAVEILGLALTGEYEKATALSLGTVFCWLLLHCPEMDSAAQDRDTVSAWYKRQAK